MTAAEVFESVTGRGSTDFALLVSILNRHGTWCLIGGLAVNCYVEPVFTLDADLVVVSAELEAIKAELTTAGFSMQQFPHSHVTSDNMTGNSFHLSPVRFTCHVAYHNVERSKYVSRSRTKKISPGWRVSN